MAILLGWVLSRFPRSTSTNGVLQIFRQDECLGGVAPETPPYRYVPALSLRRNTTNVTLCANYMVL